MAVLFLSLCLPIYKAYSGSAGIEERFLKSKQINSNNEFISAGDSNVKSEISLVLFPIFAPKITDR